ncbi:MAG: PD-(D/E)XK nuclease family protein, partial [Clostridia bacterium]|nr:PD-(D/E)XK nuclease family protein [Clostridia bacterium]
SLFKPKNLDLTITKGQAEKIYNSVSISASRLEEYYQCAFKQFIHYGIHPKRRKLYQLNRMDTGSILHGVIEEFSRHIIAETSKIKDGGASKDEVYESLKDGILKQNMVEKIVESRLKENELFKRDNIGKTMENRISAICKEALISILNELKTSDFVMTYSEKELKDFGDYTIEGVKLSGRIDRVDISDKGIRIIDYKAGGSTITPAEVYDGVKLQLFLYMSKAINYYKEKEKRDMLPRSLEYVQIEPKYKSVNIKTYPDTQAKLVSAGIYVDKTYRRRDLTSGKYTDESLQKLVALSDIRAQEAVKSIYGGDIAIRPYATKSELQCNYCDYKSICKNFDGANKRLSKGMKMEEILDEKDKLE